MPNPEKMATLGTQDEEKQNKNTTQYVLDTTVPKQTHIIITYNKTWALLQNTQSPHTSKKFIDMFLCTDVLLLLLGYTGTVRIVNIAMNW